MAKDHGAKRHDIEPYVRSAAAEDSNFENLVANWSRLRDRLTIFLGAGASVGARNRAREFLPSAIALRNDIWAKFMCDDAKRSTFDPLTLGMMTLEHAAALAEARAGRAAIEEYVVERFDCVRPMWQHAIL